MYQTMHTEIIYAYTSSEKVISTCKTEESKKGQKETKTIVPESQGWKNTTKPK